MITTKELVKSIATKKTETEGRKVTQEWRQKPKLDRVVECIVDAIASGDGVRLMGLGTFTVEDKPAHVARNPRTGETINVPAKKAPKFKISASLKDAVNK